MLFPKNYEQILSERGPADMDFLFYFFFCFQVLLTPQPAQFANLLFSSYFAVAAQ